MICVAFILTSLVRVLHLIMSQPVSSEALVTYEDKYLVIDWNFGRVCVCVNASQNFITEREDKK